MQHSLLFKLRLGAAVASIAVQAFIVTPAFAARPEFSDVYKWRIDNQWLTQSQGGFGDAYSYDTGLFYYTLPSRSQASALHPYFRSTYYQYYHDLPPPPSYQSPVTWQEARDCGNYSYMRPNRVTPYGYRCTK
ncbi:MAG: hypothetical protein PHS73_04000 [Candidatus Peribacteraceae bacterium]|nr:hypothetical protein [Candidatus Peribacteraceae bacterium]